MEIVDRLEDSLPERFEPDTLLPAQYYELMYRRHSLEGERKLMFAVLADAIECYLKNMSAKQRKQRVLFYEAQNWVNAKHRVGLFSYETICEAFGINASSLRKALDQRRIRNQGGTLRLSSRRSRRAKRLAAQPGAEKPGAASDLSSSAR